MIAMSNAQPGWKAHPRSKATVLTDTGALVISNASKTKNHDGLNDFWC